MKIIFSIRFLVKSKLGNVGRASELRILNLELRISFAPKESSLNLKKILHLNLLSASNHEQV